MSNLNERIINLNPGPKFSQKAKQASHTLYNTKATTQDVKKRDDQKRVAVNLQDMANAAREKYMAAVEVYKQRTNPKTNQYSDKTVVLADGTRGYVNNLGYFQKYDNEKNTVDLNRCPPKRESIEASYAANEVSLLNTSSIIGLAESKSQYTSCGQEGKHIFVSSIVASAPPATPLKCVQLDPDSMKVATYPGESDPNQFTYDSCKRYAMDNGYSYFGLQNYKSGDNTNICLVGNNYAKILGGGDAKNSLSTVEVWNSSSITSPNSVRYRPLKVGRHRWWQNKGSENIKHLRNILDDSSVIVGNKRLNSGQGTNDLFSVKQVGKDVIIERLNGRGWAQDLVLPTFSVENKNAERGMKLLESREGQLELQIAYRDWKRQKLGGDIVVERQDDIAEKPPPFKSIKIVPTGQILAYPKEGGQGNVVLRIPSTVARDACNELVGPITFLGATYGSNCENSKSKDNNALENLVYIHDRDNNPNVFNFKVTNRLVPQDPAPGCPKDLIVNYKCGDKVMPNKVLKEHRYGEINCNITRSEAGECTTELRIIGGDNPRGLAGLELIMLSGNRENTVWQWYLSGPQTKELIEDTTPADNDYLRGAKFVGKIDSTQIELNAGDYAVSANGKLELRINENGHLAVSVRTNRNTCVTGADGRNTTLNRETAFIYSVPYEATNPKAMGSLGYVDRNGILHPYEKSVIKPGKGYRRMNDTKVEGSDLPQQPVNGPTLEKCMDKCNQSPDCYGAVFEKNTGMCYLKSKEALKAQTYTARNNIYVERKVKLDKSKIPKGCQQYPVAYVDSILWNAYPKGNPMKPNSKCDLQQFLQEPAIVDLRKDWLDKQQEADRASSGISRKSVDTIDDRYLQKEEGDMNDSSAQLNKIVYDNTMDNKLVQAVYPYAGELPKDKKVKYVDVNQVGKKTEGFTIATGDEDYNEITENQQPRIGSPSQRARTTRFRYLNGILNDSELVVTESNFKYVLWSMIALFGSIIAFRLLRKLN